MKKLTIISFVAIITLVIAVGCSNVRREPGKVYMPDMAYSRAYETYSPSPVFVDGQTNREPVSGTVKRGDAYPFHVAMDKAGDTANYYASRAVKNPLPALSADDLKEAERLYLINCGICHGTKLDGNGPLYNGGDGPYPAKPATLVGDAKYESMPEGQMYYSTTYGKNLMGSYASQLQPKQRWMVIAYIKSKQAKPAAAAAPAGAADSTAKK
ncbi:MAG: cytochrome c [Sphingobacteriales bacterium]|nr:MAG: cytochrome c [Sphingobacteriales bacterium]